MSASKLQPVVISGDTKHKVTMFNSPDHSIEPLVDFIDSAKKSIDMYIPDLVSWTYDSNTPRLPPADWAKEENPLFQVLANTGVTKKTVLMRIITNGPQIQFIDMYGDMWEWLLLLNAQIHFTNTIKIGGILIILDGGDRILLTSMDSSKSSFIINRETSIIMDQPNDDLVKLFNDAFTDDFSLLNSTPFFPTAQLILGNPPKIDPVSAALIQTNVFKITSIEQPPAVLVESPLAYVTDITVVRDAEFTLAMAGPNSVEKYLIEGLQVPYTSFLQIGIRSLPYKPFVDAILGVYENKTKVTSVDLSYTLNSKSEADESNANLLIMHDKGMFGRLFLGPLYDESDKTKDYYTYNGQAYYNANGIVYFMTGSFTEDDVTEKRNFYVAFNSPAMSKAITRLISGDTLYATKYNGDHQQQVADSQTKTTDKTKDPPSKK